MNGVKWILLLEDNPRDAELIEHALRRGASGFKVEHADSRRAFIHCIKQRVPDLILSDFSLPTLDGYTALGIAQKKCPDVPFIFVSGTLGEETAIETLKKGATDYVLKAHLSRLVPSVQRALREAKERTGRRRAQEQLRRSHKQLRTLSVHLQQVREAEQIRIAREVHDELGQSLTGLKLQLIWLASRLPRQSKLLHAKARSMAMNIDETIVAVRRIATELRPGVLDTAGLLAALEWQANQFQTQTGIVCEVKAGMKETHWDQDLNTAFFRIFQEALTNIIRHAKATKVEVRLAEAGGQVVLEVTDNGRGISKVEIHNTRSIGLLGIRERAVLLGGTLRIKGVRGKGTTLTARIPKTPVTATRSHSHENPHH
ncbi:MAG: response regulator [Verrucomicrobia bacterium]|nr:response regulator [Verrucomicrobiota bacterium]